MRRAMFPLLGLFLAFLAGLGLVGLSLVAPRPARAVPSYAEQTGLRCVSCHVGAFGPQLTQTGRDFKLNGYTSNDGGDHFPPLSAFAQTSFTHTNADQPGGAAPGFRGNDNPTLDQASLFLAGQIAGPVGMFGQVTYDGVAHQFTWDNLDIRYANDAKLGGKDLVWGLTFNNAPTVQDLWNTTPAWGFPFAASRLAPIPAAATLIDNGLAQTVVGLGAYAQWNDLVYIEFDLYRGLNAAMQRALGVVSPSPPNLIDGVAPYWRLALQQHFGPHYVELGTYGIAASQFPSGITTAGTDHITDVALDATWQFDPSPKVNVSAYTTWIEESEDLNASRVVAGTNPHDRLSTFRTNVSTTYAASYTANAQWFQTIGSSDAALFGFPASPNSAGWIGELDWTPGGKDGSFLPDWLNVKVSLQYVAYTRFNGTTQNASANNTLYTVIWWAVPLNW